MQLNYRVLALQEGSADQNFKILIVLVLLETVDLSKMGITGVHDIVFLQNPAEGILVSSVFSLFHLDNSVGEEGDYHKDLPEIFIGIENEIVIDSHLMPI